ncbi:peptide/nickel transport system substrate-binding protein [Bacillus oleivorans]|uniref:Peptide/nickel transport system substrate-binding protein n=1 Tax=Bacillus oleivorans TaxID=1448271 RepID=A0A285D3U6_9BACI|nr:ABC transporter substrate-binding protein [Bacillus oleivorans]SNX74452.1 peptide/nickel transport system substrate-binding protein [Bacillus oleivorans]
MKKYLVSFVLVIMLVLTCFSSIYAEVQTESLTIGITQDENALNPYTYVTGYPGLDLVNLLYDNLFVLDENNIPQPWLVKEYSVSKDGLTYEFTLHENIKWHDGEALTAYDVKFTIDYFIVHPKSRFTNPLQSIASVEVQDDTSFTLVLSQADPNFMIQPLADLPILPEHIWTNVTDPDNETNAVGSGPYQLVEHSSGQYYKMAAHKDYFMGEPPIGEIVFPIIEDTTAMFTALQAGEIDAISTSIAPELVNQFESNPALKVVRGAGYSTTLFQINAEKYPMSETAFRKAIDYAIDKQNLVDTLLLGYAELGSPGFIHPSSLYYNDELTPVFDPDQAEQLLEEAGFTDTDGDGFREDQNGEQISLTTLVYSNNPIRIRAAELISESLNNIGIRNTVQAMDATTVDSLMWPEFDVSKGRDYDLGLWGWSNTMQLFPDRMIELFHSDPSIGSVNIGGYSNPEFDQLSEQLQSTLDEEERTSIIKEMQAFIAEEAPFITLYYQEIVNAYNPEVYDGYVFQTGKGIINKLSFVPGEKVEAPATEQNNSTNDESSAGTTGDAESETESASSGSANTTIFLVGGLIAAVAVGFIFIKRKSKKNNDSDDFGF